MLEIKCDGCENHCCGQNPHLTPVLVPSEEEKLGKYARVVQTPHREIFVLDKKKNRNCVLLDDKTQRCTDYGNRPLECIIYPFLLTFEKNMSGVVLDKRYCSHLDSLKFDKQLIYHMLDNINFPKNWIKAYESLENC